MEALLEERHYTYADYCAWDDSERWELIDGIAYAMSPAPSRIHQTVSGRIFRKIGDYLDGRSCQVFFAPFDVRLNAADADDTVVQPDILVVCDDSKLDDRGCIGAPDMVMEILSQSTAIHDRVIKFKKYLQAGVREYWIVDPDSKTVSAHVLKDGEYVTRAYAATDTAPVHVLDGFTLDLADVFTE